MITQKNFRLIDLRSFYFDLIDARCICGLLLLCVLGCEPLSSSDALQIQSGRYIQSAECELIEKDALVISLGDDYDQFIKKCLCADVKQAMKAYKIIDWNESFLYLTRDHSLVKIRKHRQMKVQAAILKKRTENWDRYLYN